MKKIKKLLVIVALLIGPITAIAAVTASGVSYSNNYITFTLSGDLSDYSAPSAQSNVFGIVYSGNLFNYPSSNQNILTGNPVQGNAIDNPGNTGLFYGQSSNAYTWLNYISDLSLSTTFTGSGVTISWLSPLAPMLNTTGTGSFNFIWGNGYYGPTAYTILDTIDVIGGNIQNVITVPEPASIILIGLGFAGIWFARNRKLA